MGGPGGRISQGIASWISGLGMGKGVVEGRIPDLLNFMRLRKKKSPCTLMPSMSSCNQGQKNHRAGNSGSLSPTLAHPPQDSFTNKRKPKKKKKSEDVRDTWFSQILSGVTPHLHSGSNPKYLVNRHHLHGKGSIHHVAHSALLNTTQKT